MLDYSTDNDSLFEDLSGQQDIVKYITFMPRMVDKNTGLPLLSDEKISEMHVEQLSSLTSFLNYTLIGKPVKKKRKTPDFSHTFGFAKSIYHVLIFIEETEFILLKQEREANIQFVTKIIEFLDKHKPNGSKLILYVNDAQLFSDIRQLSPQVSSLRRYYNQQMQKLTLLCPPPANEVTITLELTGIIDNVTNTIDVNTSYFPMSPLQPSFERLIMSDLLPFNSQIQEIISSFAAANPSSFIDNILSLCIQIIKHLGITRRYSDSAVSYLLYRFIFDELYPTNPFFQNTDIFENPFPCLNEVTNEQLQLPLSFCPTNMDVSLRPRDVFRNDPYFGKAVNKFEEIIFYNNPFDIIASIMQTVSLIEQAASAYDTEKTLVFPFEVTFGLFLAVVLSSCAYNNIVNLAKFVDLYTPQTGMCPNFDYARAKILACATELVEMEQELSKNNLSPNSE